MTYAEAKVIAQTLIGRGNIEPLMLEWFFDQGRREIESRENLYWMRASTDFNLTINQGEYVVSASPISLADFKDLRFLLWKGSTSYEYALLTPAEVDRLDTNYATNSTGAPEAFVLDNQTIKLFPIDPDQAYNMRLYYWAWTANPSNDTGTDELLTRWPETLIYAAAAKGVMVMTQSREATQPWMAMLEGEMKRLLEFSRARGAQNENMLLYPSGVPTQRVIPARSVPQPDALRTWTSYTG